MRNTHGCFLPLSAPLMAVSSHAFFGFWSNTCGSFIREDAGSWTKVKLDFRVNIASPPRTECVMTGDCKGKGDDRCWIVTSSSETLSKGREQMTLPCDFSSVPSQGSGKNLEKKNIRWVRKKSYIIFLWSLFFPLSDKTCDSNVKSRRPEEEGKYASETFPTLCASRSWNSLQKLWDSHLSP